MAFRILGSDADAQDVVQEAWTRYAAVDADGIRNVQAWLTTVVTRLCLDVLRRSREQPRRPEELPVVADGEDPEEVALLAGELTAAFTVVVEALTPAQRVALILHDVFGVPFEEIAHILGTTADPPRNSPAGPEDAYVGASGRTWSPARRIEWWPPS